MDNRQIAGTSASEAEQLSDHMLSLVRGARRQGHLNDLAHRTLQAVAVIAAVGIAAGGVNKSRAEVVPSAIALMLAVMSRGHFISRSADYRDAADRLTNVMVGLSKSSGNPADVEQARMKMTVELGRGPSIKPLRYGASFPAP